MSPRALSWQTLMVSATGGYSGRRQKNLAS